MAYSPPEFMTCSELFRQDDKYIREYATVRSQSQKMGVSVTDSNEAL